MEQNKKTLYIYLVIFCIQILVVIGAGLWEVLNGYTVAYALSEFDTNIVGIFALSFLFSFVPVYISGKNLPWRHWLVWIIPVVSLIPVPYLVYDMYTCTEKFCGLFGYFFIALIFWVDIMYIVYYLVGKYLRKWDFSVSLFILKVFLVLYTATSLFIAYNYVTVIRPYQKLFERVEQSYTFSLEEALALCNQVSMDRGLASYRGSASYCWGRIIKDRPGIDICSLVKEKTNCLQYMREVYRTYDDCSYPRQEYLKDTEGKYKTDANGNGLVDQPKTTELYQKCWTDSSKKYPNIDICLDAYNNKDEECRLFLDSQK